MEAPANTHEDATALASVNISASNSQPLSPLTSSAHTDTLWNGSQETILGWVTELQTTIASRAPHLYTFVTDYIVHEHGKTIISCPGQAAQIAGDLPHPPYDWHNPAPDDIKDYPMYNQAIRSAYHRIHHHAYMRDPRIGDELPPHMQEDYPIDKDTYIISPTMLKNHDIQLRNFILNTITDPATKALLADDFPTQGRRLLQTMQARAQNPLRTSQINFIKQQINQLVEQGITSDVRQTTLRRSATSSWPTSAFFVVSRKQMPAKTRQQSRPCNSSKQS